MILFGLLLVSDRFDNRTAQEIRLQMHFLSKSVGSVFYREEKIFPDSTNAIWRVFQVSCIVVLFVWTSTICHALIWNPFITRCSRIYRGCRWAGDEQWILSACSRLCDEIWWTTMMVESRELVTTRSPVAENMRFVTSPSWPGVVPKENVRCHRMYSKYALLTILRVPHKCATLS